MQKYRIAIEETVSEEFEVEAESKDDAIKKAIEKYRTGEFILEPGKLQYKQISIVDDENDEWIEF